MTVDYVRQTLNNRGKRQIDLGQAGSFLEITTDNSDPEQEYIGGRLFKSTHCTKTVTDYRVFTALRSEEAPSVLYIIWRDFPHLRNIEEGGDYMLQAFHQDPRLKYLLVDNTFVKSGWMKDDVVTYLNTVWYPGLIEVGVKKFAHLQAKSALAAQSFENFGKDVNNAITDLAKSMNREPFEYFPIKTSETDQGETELRKASLKRGLSLFEE